MDYGAVKIIGLEEVKAMFHKAQKTIANPEVSFKRALAVLDRWVQENFKTEGGKVGGWRPLKEATIRARMRRRNKTGDIRILQDNGTLKRNWKHISGKDYAGIQSTATAGKSNYPYGLAHDEGRGNNPQRRILPTEEEIWPKIKPLFEDEIMRSFT